MKKSLSVYLVILIVISTIVVLGGCSKKQSTANVPDSNQEKQVTTETAFKQPELLDSGYTITQSGKFCKIYYSVEIKNPNDGYVIAFPTITLTSKDSSGTILDTQDQVLTNLAAGDTFKYGSFMLYEGVLADIVDISVSSGTDNYNYLPKDDKTYPTTDMFQISNTSHSLSGDGFLITGELTNTTANSYNTILVTVNLYKDGKLVGGSMEYVDNVAPNQTKPFKINDIPVEIQFDKYEVNACPWA